MNKFKFSNKYNNPYSNDIEKRKDHLVVKVINNDKYSCNAIITTSRKSFDKKEKNIKMRAVNEWVK